MVPFRFGTYNVLNQKFLGLGIGLNREGHPERRANNPKEKEFAKKYARTGSVRFQEIGHNIRLWNIAALQECSDLFIDELKGILGTSYGVEYQADQNPASEIPSGHPWPVPRSTDGVAIIFDNRRFQMLNKQILKATGQKIHLSLTLLDTATNLCIQVTTGHFKGGPPTTASQPQNAEEIVRLSQTAASHTTKEGREVTSHFQIIAGDFNVASTIIDPTHGKIISYDRPGYEKTTFDHFLKPCTPIGSFRPIKLYTAIGSEDILTEPLNQRKIDHIFVSTSYTNFCSHRNVMDPPPFPDASDHLPLVVDFLPVPASSPPPATTALVAAYGSSAAAGYAHSAAPSYGSTTAVGAPAPYPHLVAPPYPTYPPVAPPSAAAGSYAHPPAPYYGSTIAVGAPAPYPPHSVAPPYPTYPPVAPPSAAAGSYAHPPAPSYGSTRDSIDSVYYGQTMAGAPTPQLLESSEPSINFSQPPCKRSDVDLPGIDLNKIAVAQIFEACAHPTYEKTSHLNILLKAFYEVLEKNETPFEESTKILNDFKALAIQRLSAIVSDSPKPIVYRFIPFIENAYDRLAALATPAPPPNPNEPIRQKHDARTLKVRLREGSVNKGILEACSHPNVLNTSQLYAFLSAFQNALEQALDPSNREEVLNGFRKEARHMLANYGYFHIELLVPFLINAYDRYTYNQTPAPARTTLAGAPQPSRTATPSSMASPFSPAPIAHTPPAHATSRPATPATLPPPASSTSTLMSRERLLAHPQTINQTPPPATPAPARTVLPRAPQPSSTATPSPMAPPFSPAPIAHTPPAHATSSPATPAALPPSVSSPPIPRSVGDKPFKRTDFNRNQVAFYGPSHKKAGQIREGMAHSLSTEAREVYDSCDDPSVEITGFETGEHFNNILRILYGVLSSYTYPMSKDNVILSYETELDKSPYKKHKNSLIQNLEIAFERAKKLSAPYTSSPSTPPPPATPASSAPSSSSSAPRAAASPPTAPPRAAPSARPVLLPPATPITARPPAPTPTAAPLATTSGASAPMSSAATARPIPVAVPSAGSNPITVGASALLASPARDKWSISRDVSVNAITDARAKEIFLRFNPPSDRFTIEGRSANAIFEALSVLLQKEPSPSKNAFQTEIESGSYGDAANVPGLAKACDDALQVLIKSMRAPPGRSTVTVTAPTTAATLRPTPPSSNTVTPQRSKAQIAVAATAVAVAVLTGLAGIFASEYLTVFNLASQNWAHLECAPFYGTALGALVFAYLHQRPKQTAGDVTG